MKAIFAGVIFCCCTLFILFFTSHMTLDKSSYFQPLAWRFPLCTAYLTNADYCQKCSLRNLDHNFKEQLRRSLSNTSLAFIGDSRIRHMFAYLRSLLDGRHVVLKETINDTLHWDEPRQFQLSFYARLYPDTAMRALVREWRNGTRPLPHYVIMETGAWTVFRYGEAALPEFRRNLTVLAEDFAALSDLTTVIWIRTLPINPVELAINTQWSHRRNADVLAERFGRVVEEVARNAGIVLWDAVYQDSREYVHMYKDVVHPGLTLLRKAICQLLFALDTGSCRCSLSGSFTKIFNDVTFLN
ncbi:N-acetylneuraminate 9-O-acetyltransferase-like [Paramacrobiotus metropolitanus]|uniref:N-acetylneuraminate 9-O-acetyltransferase-like n=1 Tax=Paramacrobiotus metropolitanus TaxID=2943436 RepID=UPI0024459272|nr:N-acetylneuraminate 9-O-acetyltransferase-like [Paramacrobiotus metropolitanus]